LPSNAAHESLASEPVSRDELPVDTIRRPVPGPRPSSVSSLVSSTRFDTRAVPLISNVRVLGRSKVLDIESSGSVLGGIVAARRRCSSMTSGSALPALPAPLSRFLGSCSDEITGPTPGMRTSAKPTGLAPVNSV
jgi:hypothetical protein